MFNPLFIILKAAVSNESFLRVFGGIRQVMLSQTSKVVPLAMMIAGILITIKLAKMTYTIMADEKDGGFGGVTLWEIMRPLAVLFLISISSTVISILDTATDYVSVAISRTVDHASIADSRASLVSELQKQEDSLETTKTKILNEFKQKQAGNYRELQNGGAFYDPTGGGSGQWKQGNMSDEQFAQLMQAIKTTDDNKSAFTKMINNTIKATKRVKKKYKKIEDLAEQPEKVPPKAFFTSVCFWISDMLAYCMMAFADIILCCMAVVAPITFALSIVDRWKDAILSFCSKYFEVSMWKVTANVILAVCAKAFTASIVVCQKMGKQAVDTAVATGVFEQSYVTVGAASTIATIISISCIIATLSIPGITSTVLSLGGGPAAGGDGAKGGAVAIVKAPGKAVSGGFSAGMNIGKLNAIKKH